MNRRRAWLLLMVASHLGLPIVSLASAAPTGSIGSNQFVGCWYGEDFQPLFHRKVGWFMNRRSDGTFTIEFRELGTDDNLPFQTEAGPWRLVEGKYRTVTTHVDGTAVNLNVAHYWDEYEIVSVETNQISLLNVEMKREFSSTRVSCDAARPNHTLNRTGRHGPRLLVRIGATRRLA